MGIPSFSNFSPAHGSGARIPADLFIFIHFQKSSWFVCYRLQEIGDLGDRALTDPVKSP